MKLKFQKQTLTVASKEIEDAEQEAFREIREQEQEESLDKEQRIHSSAKIARRPKTESLAYDDSQHGSKDFAMLRLRREHEEVFGSTKKERRKSFHKRRRSFKL